MTAERAAAGAAVQARQAELDKEAAVSSAYEETARAQGEAAPGRSTSRRVTPPGCTRVTSCTGYSVYIRREVGIAYFSQL